MWNTEYYCIVSHLIYRYRDSVRRRSKLLRDQPEHPLDRAIYWTEYVLRHKGAYHLQSPAKEYTFLQYYLIDVAFFCLIVIYISMKLFIKVNSIIIRLLISFIPNPQYLPQDMRKNEIEVKADINGISNNADIINGEMTLRRNGTTLSNNNVMSVKETFINGVNYMNGDHSVICANRIKMSNTAEKETVPLKLYEDGAKSLKLH